MESTKVKQVEQDTWIIAKVEYEFWKNITYARRGIHKQDLKSSGGRVSEFRRSVIRHSPATGPPVRHRQSVIISGLPSPSLTALPLSLNYSLLPLI